MNALFVTGFLRSGTTLVTRLLQARPELSFANQPFPHLFYQTKRAFLEMQGLPIPDYPLGTLFPRVGYSSGTFFEALEQLRFSSVELVNWLEDVDRHPGELLSGLLHRLAERDSHDGNLVEHYRWLVNQFPGLLERPAAHIAGAKEVFCEEFLPRFLADGVRVVLVLRDPRDVVASIRAPLGSNYVNGGLTLPYILRKWRKSVAYALTLSRHPHFHVIRFEELVRTPSETLERLGAFLGIDADGSEWADCMLLDESGTPWPGNSSFEGLKGISDSAVGRFLGVLDTLVIEIIETLCGPEMLLLGLEPTTAAFDEGWKQLAADRAMERFAPLLTRADIGLERERHQRLRVFHNDHSTDATWFVLPRVRQRLANAVVASEEVQR